MRNAVSLSAALTVFAILLVGCGGASEPDLPERRIPVPGLLVYTVGVDLWIQDENGPRLLIAAGQDQQLLHPAISPDGTRVAYVVFQLTHAEGTTIGTDLAVSNIDNPAQRVVLARDGAAEFVWNPRWTPDGEALIFTHEPVGAPISVKRLYLEHETLDLLREDARDAAIDPDGSRIVFVSSPYSGDPHLVVRRLDDGSETVLDPQRSWQPRPFRIPRFSADGGSVLFSAGQYLPQVSALALGLNGPEDIWRFDLATGELRQLAALGEDQPDFTLSEDGRHALVFGAFGAYLISTTSPEPAYAVAPGEFHGWIDWVGTISDEEWAAIREAVFELPDAAQ
ncbi:MAG: hypothetical protein OXH38_05330 [Chloroflexi bacterium]|nr:hypothetical protein [Chloroflexota bacterium]